MSENESKLKKFITALKAKKHLEIIIAIIAVALMLIIYFTAKPAKSSESSAKTSSESVYAYGYCEKTEQSLVKALESIKGVGKVKAAVNWESGVERVIAYATNASGGGSSATPTVITVQGGGSPIVLKELYPKAVGVIIVCEGGNNVAVKLDVINAVAVLLNIPQNKINVYAMK